MAGALKLGVHRYVLAPMVENSELAFRMLTRRYGCELCYSPMLNAKMLCMDPSILDESFSTCPEDRPLVIQLCGNDPVLMLRAAQMVEGFCDAIDINLGCPQGIAKRGHYGSFLLEEWDRIGSIVRSLVSGVRVPITCKIRLLSSGLERTIELAEKLESWGCSLLTVHGRTKEMKKDQVGVSDWEAVRQIRSHLHIPVLVNGGIAVFADVERCLLETGCEGVMSGEALLENPSLFSPQIPTTQDQLALEYLEMVEKYKAQPAEIRSHLFKILHTGLQQNFDLRTRLALFPFYKEGWMDELRLLVRELTDRMVAAYGPWRSLEITKQEKSWYRRFQRPRHAEDVDGKSASLDMLESVFSEF